MGLKDDDIVVWKGIIGSRGVIRYLADFYSPSNFFRYAQDCEIEFYEKKKYTKNGENNWKRQGGDN